MKTLKTALFCTFLIIVSLLPNELTAQNARPLVAIKTNPLSLSGPVLNLSLEVRTGAHSSVEFMGGYLPENRVMELFPSVLTYDGNGFVGHLMYRYYPEGLNGFFFSGGLFGKQIDYMRIVDPVGEYSREWGQLSEVGLKALVGFQFPLFHGWGILEPFAGGSLRLRQIDYYREPFLGSFFTPFEAVETSYGAGINMGVNIGFAVPDPREK
jgi:hypothetical protein